MKDLTRAFSGAIVALGFYGACAVPWDERKVGPQLLVALALAARPSGVSFPGVSPRVRGSPCAPADEAPLPGVSEPPFHPGGLPGSRKNRPEEGGIQFPRVKSRSRGVKIERRPL